MVKINTCNNGFKYIIDNNKCGNIYCIYLFIRVGSAYEETQSNNKGISHFLEHMLFKGSDKYNNISYILDINGFDYNAMTMKECTFFYIRSSDITKLELIIDILYEMMFKTNFVKKTFQLEKQVVKDEISLDNYSDDIYTLLESIMFDKKYWKKDIDNYNYPIPGYVDDIDFIKFPDIIQYYKKYYRPNNMYMVICGNIRNSHDNIDNIIRKTFATESYSHIPRKLKNFKNISTIRNYPICKGIENQGEVSDVVISYPICGFNNIDKYALNLYSFILSKGISSVLFQILREKYGIVYEIKGEIYHYLNFGVLNITLSTHNNNILKGIKLCLDTLEYDIDKKQLDKVKKMYIEEFNFKNENLTERTERIGFNELYNPNSNLVNTDINTIRNITLENINRVKNKYIKNNKMIICHNSNISNTKILSLIN